VLTPGLWVLIVLAVCIGVGSGLWHTFATDWASVLDVAPITLFQLAFLWLYGRHAVRLPAAAVVALLAVHVALGVWLTRFDEWLNGSLVYIPTIVLTAVHQYATAGPVPRATVASAVVFCVSLTARSIDLVVCRQLPVGTHFLWHVLNGVVVYLAMYTTVAVWVTKRDTVAA
jgi:hypothetical protein